MRIHLNQRPRKKKEKTYTYYSLARSYRDDKTKVPKKEILENLGTLTNSEIDTWKMRLAVFNGDITNLTDLRQLEFIDSKNYLDVALLSLIYDRLGVNAVFKMAPSNKEIGVQEVAKILVLSRCFDPTANRKTVDWFEQSYLPKIMNIHPTLYNKDKIFHELVGIHNKKKWLQKHFYFLSKKMMREGTELYFFDGTTSYFEGRDCNLATPGKDKTTGFQSKTILLCLLTDKKGFPIVWDVFSGSKRDITEFKKIALAMSKDMNISNVTLCFDRGVASASNFDTIEKLLNSKFITGLCRNQIDPVFDIEKFSLSTRSILLEKHQVEVSIASHASKKILPINGFYRMGTDRFFKDLGIQEGRRYVVSFNAAIFEQEQITRSKNIEWVKAEIGKLNDDLSTAERDRDGAVLEKKIEELLAKNSLKNIVQYTIIPQACHISGFTVQTYKVGYTVSQEAIDKASECDGIFVFITNHIESSNGHFIISAAEIVSHYKDKYVIENAFRHLKSFLDLRPFYVRLDDHVRAHVDICMCSYFLNTWIYHQLKQQNISLEEFYRELKINSPTCLLKNNEYNIVLLKLLSPKMKKILEIFEANEIIGKEVLGKHQIMPFK